MAQAAWEKPQNAEKTASVLKPARSGRWQFLLGGALILSAVAYLVFSGTLVGARFFISVEELLSDAKYSGQTVRITGAVVGETIRIDDSNPAATVIEFTIAHIPTAPADLAETLHIAANDPAATQLKVYVSGQPKPELLQHEAQAILSGTLGEDGIFYASELNFKCPSRFEEGGPMMGDPANSAPALPEA